MATPIIAIANQKGGTGKTTTALTLGAVLAVRGLRVLLLDLDPQSSLTQSVGIDATGQSLAEVIGGPEPGVLDLKNIIRAVQSVPGLFIAPGDLAMAACELGLVMRLGRENVIKNALASVDGYDLVILDCPPSLGLLTVNALTAATTVIAATLPAASDLRGLKLFLGSLQQVRRALNPGLSILGVVVCQYDARLLAHQNAIEALQNGNLPVLATVPRTVKVQEAAGAALPLCVYEPNSKAGESYSELADEVEKWQKSLT